MAKKQYHNPSLLKGRPNWSALELATIWAKTAGRCEICNRILYENEDTGDRVNIANLAHIIAHGDGGTRADVNVSAEYKRNLDNIILLCNPCHTTVDRDGVKYTIPVLRRYKGEHEEKIRLQTTPTAERQRRIVIFDAPIAAQHSPIRKDDAVEALFSEQFPMEEPLVLNIPVMLESEPQSEYWKRAKEHIDREFRSWMYSKINEFPKIGIFALAPQPLLVYLGWKLGDKYNLQIFQRHRNQDKPWKWLNPSVKTPSFEIVAPSETAITNVGPDSKVVLSLNVSFDISSRVRKYLNSARGDLHWQISTTGMPSTDYVQSEEQLSEFKHHIHNVLNEITQKIGDRPIHLYLSVPVSLAVTFGTAIMPKATSEIIIYDYVKTEDLDIEAIKINFNDGI